MASNPLFKLATLLRRCSGCCYIKTPTQVRSGWMQQTTHQLSAGDKTTQTLRIACMIPDTAKQELLVCI